MPGTSFQASGVAVDDATAGRLGIAGERGPQSLIAAGNGAAWDEASRCLLFMGGGRRDYGGNEVYRFDLDGLRWQRLTEPSPLPAATAAGACPMPPDAPAAGVSGDGLVVAGGRLHAFLSDPFCPKGKRGRIDTAWSLDLSAPDRGWQRLAGAPPDFAGALTARNPHTGGIVVFGSDRGLLAEVDPAATVPAQGREQPEAKLSGSDICAESDDAVYCLARGRALYAVEYGPGRRADRLRRLGEPPLGGVGTAPCMVWHPQRRTLVVLSGARSVYEIEPRDLTVTRWPNPEGPAPSEDTARLVSKCAYDQRTDTIVVVRDPRSDVALYRLPAPGSRQEEADQGPGYVRGLPLPGLHGG
ncbi:hypothetical protein [Caenispirillum bisanense]|uniref:hypothetical protein n=1 Tax=Caenispirillum bisanense TaxID=414052 RepID=UPI0031D2F350